MTSRRAFLRGLIAATTIPSVTWADAGAPSYVAAARELDGSYALFGLTADGQDVFRIPLPDRGHAAAAHPVAPEVVAFARRPGRFALVIDCLSGTEKTRLDSPAGRHFYGHGAFSLDGDTLATTENDYATGQGIIGLWSRREGYRRIGELSSGGIGPHEIKRLPMQDVFVVANGGLQTHPNTGRETLNPDTMRANLCFIDLAGSQETQTLEMSLRQNSIRHLDIARDGQVAFGMQWKGAEDVHPPLLGMTRQNEQPVLASAETEHLQMQDYVGSVSFSGDGKNIGITSPRGGMLQVFDTSGNYVRGWHRADLCGVAATSDGFLTTDGGGGVFNVRLDSEQRAAAPRRAWDNHLVKI